jgi:hypothetical protein
VALNRDGASVHPSLLRAASVAPLTPDATFDADTLREALRQEAALPAPATSPIQVAAPSHPGARA